MATLPFGPWQPDVNDLNRQYTQSVLNVVPRSDGYGPFMSLAPYSQELPAAARGAFFARKQDGSVAIFAGTSTRLYLLDNTNLSWIDVSRGGGSGGSGYTELDIDTHWSFVQFNDVVIATQNNDDMQAFTLQSDTEFDDLSADAPRAAYITIINRFLVAAGIDSAPNRVQWSALNDITNWLTLEADAQDLPDGGAVRGIRGGELGIILQSGAIRRIQFIPGSATIFQIDRIVQDIGTDFSWSIVDAAGQIFFVSQKGFMKLSPDGGLQPIGEQRVNLTFFARFDPSAPQLVIGCANPDKNHVFWSFKSLDSVDDDAFDQSFLYDYVLDRWTPIAFSGRFLASVAQAGFTLEGLGTLNSYAVTGAADNGSGLIRLTFASTAEFETGQIKDIENVGGVPNATGTWTITVIDGTHIDLQGSTFAGTYTSGGYMMGPVDDLPIESLDDVTAASLPKFAAFADERLQFFTGGAMEATVETSEQTGMMSRIFCNGLMPMTDAPTVYGSLGTRENLNATPVYQTEHLINAQGFIPARRSTRHLRAKLRIPADTVWTHVTGVEPQYEPDGER